jgi:protein-tyrosine phosphatase
LNESAAVRDELVSKLNTLLNGAPSVLAGCEYFFSADAVELWERGSGGPLTGLNRTRYLLVEFDSGIVPASAETIFHEFAVLGVIPVIAHPERCSDFVEMPGRLARLVEMGACTQITAGAVAGDFGSRAAKVCREFLRLGLVHLIASDAHSISTRPPRLQAARKKIRREWGGEVETGLFDSNPRALLESKDLPWIPETINVRK